MTITEFLEARIAEDEAELAKFYPKNMANDFAYGGNDDYDQFTIGYGRALAECAAKRAVVELHENYVDGETGPAGACLICEPGGWEWKPSPETAYPCKTVRALAAVYADHPDYKQEWTP